MTKKGLVSEKSPWIGRWGQYWRIQSWGNLAPAAEELAVKYPHTWEIRLVLKQQRYNEQWNK